MFIKLSDVDLEATLVEAEIRSSVLSCVRVKVDVLGCPS